MDEERPIVPPLRKPVSELTTPVQTDGFYVELVNRDDPAYKAQAPVKRGTLYSSMIGAKQEVIDNFPNLYFLKEAKYGQSDQLVNWIWASDRTAESSFNAEVSFALEAVTSPTFARVYTIRRDVYDTSLPLELGLPLTGIVGVRITDGGVNYTHATGTIDTDAEVEFVISDGVIISGIVVNEGSSVLSQGEITIDGDGAGAVATAIIQPSSAVLIGQKKQEFPEDSPLRNEYIRIIRIYQTLPGPTINTTRLDEDGAVVNIATTQKIAATIVSGETLIAESWRKVTKQQSDNVYVGNEVVETRVIPGNAMLSTRIDDDGIVVSIHTTLKDVTEITEGETLIGGVWTKTTSKAVSALVSQEITETRVIPGNPMPTTRVDDDGKVVTIITTLKDQTLVTSGETLAGGVWTRTHKEPATLTSTVNITDLVVKEVVESRAIPGNPMPSTRIDKDGKEMDVVRTMKESAIVNTDETLSGPPEAQVWTRTHLEAITDLVGWEVVEGRIVPGNEVPSASVGADHTTNVIASTLKDAALITPGASEAGGVLTTVEQKEVSELVSEEVETDKTWIDEAFYSIAIPNVIPEVFKAEIPTRVESHTVVGIAAQPVLGIGEFERSERQLTKIFKEVRFTTIDTVSVPVVLENKGLTREFGGGTTTITYTLDLEGNMTIDSGLTVIDSDLTNLNNGYEFKVTEQIDNPVWPILQGQDYDERLDVIIPYEEQTWPAGFGLGTPKVDVKPLDRWRSARRTIDATQAAAVLDAYIMSYPSKINIDMPDRLISVEGQIQSSAGEGTNTQQGAIAFVGNYSISQKLQASAQSSVDLSPDVVLSIKQFWGNNINATHYHFFLPNPVTSADVLTKINDVLSPDTVSDWPKFNPQIVTLFTYGEHKSLQVTAVSGGSSAVNTSSSSSTTEGGVGYSIEVGTRLKTIRISPTIHPAINVSGTTSDSRSISATAFAESVGLGPAENSTQSDTATAAITPTFLPATEGATDWPTTGLYLYRVDAQPYRYGYVQFHVVIVDAADFPINI